MTDAERIAAIRRVRVAVAEAYSQAEALGQAIGLCGPLPCLWASDVKLPLSDVLASIDRITESLAAVPGEPA